MDLTMFYFFFPKVFFRTYSKLDTLLDAPSRAAHDQLIEGFRKLGGGKDQSAFTHFE